MTDQMSAEARDAEAAASAASEEPFNAVVVIREFTENGDVNTRIILSGDMRPTEVKTVLELGLKGWNQRVGL